MKHITIFDEINFEIPPMNICRDRAQKKDNNIHNHKVNKGIPRNKKIKRL